MKFTTTNLEFDAEAKIPVETLAGKGYMTPVQIVLPALQGAAADPTKIGAEFLPTYSDPATLTLLAGTVGDVTGYGLTTIPDGWQFFEASITGLSIGSQVAAIGSGAFHSCLNIIGDLVIPDSVTSIGSYAFGSCSKLESLTIGNSVTDIGSDAFNGCSNLGLAGDLVIPDSVTNIGGSAFSSCSNLAGDLLIPDSVTSIGNYAFTNCSGLTSLTIGNSVTDIGNGAFSGCSSLAGPLTIPNSVISVGGYAFSACGTLGDVYVNLHPDNFPASALGGAGAGLLYVPNAHLGSYGGAGTAWGSKTVAEWTNYPTIPN